MPKQLAFDLLNFYVHSHKEPKSYENFSPWKVIMGCPPKMSKSYLPKPINVTYMAVGLL